MPRSLRFACLSLLSLLALGPSFAAESFSFPARVPMKEEFTHSLRYVWLNKEVHESRLLHDMESLSGWSASGIGQIELSGERAIEGSASLRFRTSLRDEALIERSPGGRMMGSAAAVLRFSEPQDWSDFNRLALWVYVHPSDVRVHTFYLTFTCLDAPSSINDPPSASVIQGLTPGEWNYALWEIPSLRRDRVTEFQIRKLTTGHDAEEDGTVTYDFDRLELQRVDAEMYEGWLVAPGKIAYQHVGYLPDEPKVAIASDLTASRFQLRETRSGRVVLTRAVRTVKNAWGEFQILDFSDVRAPGEYFLWADGRTSRPFAISDTLWLEPVRKALNFYYCLRCGFDVPGIHPECHRDLQGEHNGVKKRINGGWHDAGDLSQGSFRTAMAVYAMLQLREQLERCESDPALQERLLEEALWGLDWLLRTRFGDGYRITWSGMGIYTDGILGTLDDPVRRAQNNPWENFIAAGVEALSHRVLAERDPGRAAECLQAAEEDWQAAVQLQPQWLDEGQVVLTGGGVIDNHTPFYHRWFSGGTYLTLSWGILSSLHLYEPTGRAEYAERAVDYGRLLLRCQEREFLDGIPLTGFFYTSPEKLAIVNHRHAAFEESPLLALSALCRAFPDHEDWIEWYGAATLHSEYFLKRGAGYTAPYFVLPNAVFRKSDTLSVPDPELREAMLRQYNEGTRLSEEYALRAFPIWTTRTHHGNTAVLLSQTLALAAAAQLRRDEDSENLARAQLRWVFGGNPFSQSFMYGEGYDYPPLYGYNPGDVVGALPVGMDCVRDDKPFWSASNHSTFKEIWGVPVSRFLWNAVYLAIAHDEIALEPVEPLDFSFAVKSRDLQRNRIQLQATARGQGRHEFSLRVFNGTTAEPKKSFDLKAAEETEMVWDVAITNPKIPWVAVIIPDGDPTWRQELTGTLETRSQQNSVEQSEKS